ncbi:MAG: hypothetical protein JEZ11_16360 [Desulfobacterales bacterium]|nr:hypothetical protein [Desulfobacterales bacterium]
MSAQWIEIAVSVFSAMEIGLLAAAGFATARHRGLPVAEAVAYGTMGSLMAASALLQLSMLLAPAALGWMLEGTAAALAVSVLVADRGRLLQLRGFSLSARPSGIVVAVVLAGVYLAAQALLLPPLAMDHTPLERLVAICAEFGTRQPGGPLSLAALPPLNSAVLPLMILRFGTEAGIGIFGFAAYLVLGAATYSLARRYAWPPTALTVTLVVWSMPRFVLHATSGGFELVPTAAGLVAVLALYRTVETPNLGDLAVMLCAICFSMTDGPYCLVFPLVLTALATVLLFRRHGWRYCKNSLQNNRGGGLVALPLFFLFSQSWIFAANLSAGYPWAGSLHPTPLAPNAHGILEAVANACRYLIQMIHLPVGGHFETAFARGLEQIYTGYLGPTIERTIHLAPFAVNWDLAPRTAWFGPFAVLLSLPALAFALVRAPRRLKALAVAMVGYAYLVALTVAWHGSNARLFSPFFAISGFVIAFFLPPWRLTRSGKRLLQVAAAAMLIYVALFQTDRPIIGWRHLMPATRSVWHQDVSGMKRAMAEAVRESVWWKVFGEHAGRAAEPNPPAGPPVKGSVADTSLMPQP